MVEERFGHLDMLINNAGITGSGQVSPEDAHDHLSLAFSRLRHVFVIDAVVAVLLVLRNATEVLFR